MATGASDGWRMNRRHNIGSTGATAWSNGPCRVSELYSCQCTVARRMFRCLSSSSSCAPVDHVFISTRSGQSYTDGYTDALIFSTIGPSGALGLAGPLVLFHFKSSAGPAWLSHALRSSPLHANRRRHARAGHSKPPPPPVPCAADSPPLARSFAARRRRRCSRAAAPRPRHARARLSYAALPLTTATEVPSSWISRE
jgi:hypothetical protein